MTNTHHEFINDLKTMLERWQSDAETLDEGGQTRKANQLKKCHAELQHFVDKHDLERQVYVVAANHPTRPRARVEGVYFDEVDAEQGRTEALDDLDATSAKVYPMEVR